jgi:O-Antigen ligase.
MNKLILFSLIVSFVLAMVMTGGRGPFLSMVAAIVILFVSQIRISYKHGIIRYNRYALMGFIIFIVGTIYFIFSDHPLFTNIKTRLSYFFTDQGGTSVSERIRRYHVAFDMFKESPIIGKGIDSFSVYFSIPGDYPHNIFLEFMSELGLIGLCLFVLLLLFALYSFPFKSLNNIQFKLYSWPVVLLFLLSFLNANVSGNIIGNRMLLTAIAFNQIYKKDVNKAIS